MPRIAKPRWDNRRKKWYANVGERDPNGRRREVFAPAEIGERDEAAAWEWFRKEQIRDRTAPPKSGELLADQVCERYLAWAEKQKDEGKLAASEYANKARHLGIFSDALGRREVRTLEPDDLTDFGSDLLDLYTPTYARNVCATVRAAMNWAVRDKETPLTENPTQGFKLPTIPRSPARFAERAEAAAFLAHWRTRSKRKTITGKYDRLTLLLQRILIRTGARPGEPCKLKWADIVWRGWQTSAGHWCAKAVIPPDRWKAGKATGKPRTIYFTPAITRALSRIYERNRPHPEWVFVHGRGRGGAGVGEPWASGSVLSKTTLRVRRELIAWQAETRERIKSGGRVKPWEAKRAKIVILDDGSNKLVNYRWRHTAISTLLMLGVDVATIAELTGTSPDMIYKHYGHLLDSHLQSAAERLQAGRRSS